jgi:ribosome recycling factor
MLLSSYLLNYKNKKEISYSNINCVQMKIVVTTKKGTAELPSIQSLKQLATSSGTSIRRSAQVVSIVMDVRGDLKKVKGFAKLLRQQIPTIRVSAKKSIKKNKGEVVSSRPRDPCVRCKPDNVFNKQSSRCIKSTGKRAKKLGIGSKFVSHKTSKVVKQVRFANVPLEPLDKKSTKSMVSNVKPNPNITSNPKQERVKAISGMWSEMPWGISVLKFLQVGPSI